VGGRPQFHDNMKILTIPFLFDVLFDFNRQGRFIHVVILEIYDRKNHERLRICPAP
jgi:hypothetical protein